jgi:hypothetical protein
MMHLSTLKHFTFFLLGFCLMMLTTLVACIQDHRLRVYDSSSYVPQIQYIIQWSTAQQGDSPTLLDHLAYRTKSLSVRYISSITKDTHVYVFAGGEQKLIESLGKFSDIVYVELDKKIDKLPKQAYENK